MRTIRLLVCLTYWTILTVLLLVPDPLGLLGARGTRLAANGGVLVHFCAFAILAVLACSARWPERIAGWPLALLAVYAFGAEALQALVPARTVQLQDFVENFLGIAVGIAVVWIATRLIRLHSTDQEDDQTNLKVVVAGGRSTD